MSSLDIRVVGNDAKGYRDIPPVGSRVQIMAESLSAHDALFYAGRQGFVVHPGLAVSLVQISSTLERIWVKNASLSYL